jgi:hypothetical protein
MEMREDDAFWAARRVMAFTDELIQTAVHTGVYSDPAAEAHLVSVLAKRRDKIGQVYLTAINPIVDPKIDGDGTLSFGNAAVEAKFAEAPTEYIAAWSTFDNTTGNTRPLGETRSATTSVPSVRGLPASAGSYIQVDISANSAAHATWSRPIRTHFKRTGAGWTLVGLERLPDAEPQTAPAKTASGRP